MLELAPEAVRAGHLGHGLVLVLGGLAGRHGERRSREQDLAAPLPGGDLALGEAPAVPHAAHVVLDRQGGVAGKQKGRVEGMTGPIFRRAGCGDQHLGQQFAAEGARPRALGAPALEAIVVDPGEIE